MSSEFLPSEEPRRSADPAGVPDPATPSGKSRFASRASTWSASKWPRPRPWRSFIMAGVAAVALVGGAGVANAASSAGIPATASASTASKAMSTSNSTPGPVPTSGMPSWGAGAGHPTLPVHGQVVLPKPGGGYQTVDFQRGAVSKVSTSSMTVKSSDGFTQTYAITGSTVVAAQRDGIASVTAGDQAIVIGTVSGATVTAAKIIDWTQLQHFHQQFGFLSGAHG